MDSQVKAKYEARARIVKAMAHPSRLFIVERLAEGPLYVQALTDLIGADMSTVSRHLSILKEAGIIKDERQGTKIQYTLHCPCIMGFFQCVETVLQSNKDLSSEVL